MEKIRDILKRLLLWFTVLVTLISVAVGILVEIPALILILISWKTITRVEMEKYLNIKKLDNITNWIINKF